MKVNITKPLSTAIPDKAIKPTAAETENGIPLNQRASTPPVNASGTALNLSYHWVEQLLHGNELWCDVNGMEVACRTRFGH